MSKIKGLIVLDGPDGSGKTTLAKHLVDKYDAMYFHNIKRKDIWLWHTACLRLAVKHSAHRLVVVDRLWLSECIYGAVYRGGSKYPIAARMIDRIIRRFGAAHVVAAPPTEYAVEIHKKVRPHRANELAGVRQVADFYLDVAKGNMLRDPQTCYASFLAFSGGVKDLDGWHWYDVTQHQGQKSVEIYARALVDHLVFMRKTLSKSQLDPEVWNQAGSIYNGKVLLLGDRLSGSRQDNWPFYANEMSSLYLSKALHHAKIRDELVFMMNAYDHDDKIQNNILDVARVAQKAVALGHVASAVLDRIGVQHQMIHHPSYARRFAYGLDRYSADLATAIASV